MNLDVSVIPDTDVMVVQDAFGGADLIDTTSGVRTHLEGPVEEPGYAWFFVSADGRYAASIWNPHTAAESDADNYGVLTAWDLSTGRATFRAGEDSLRPARMAISGDGSMVAASVMESGAVEVYDGANGEPLTNVTRSRARALRWCGLDRATRLSARRQSGHRLDGRPVADRQPCRRHRGRPHRVAAVDDEQLLVADQ